MNANKPKLEQKDIGHGGMRAIGDVVGKQLLEMQQTIEQDNRLINAQQQKVVEQQAEIEALKADNKQMCKALFKATRLIIRKAQE